MVGLRRRRSSRAVRSLHAHRLPCRDAGRRGEPVTRWLRGWLRAGRGSQRIVRLPGIVGSTATATASAVSSPVTRAEFVAKFRTEPDTGELSPADIDCVVGVYLKYVDKHELRQYVDGEITIDDFTEPDDSAGAEQDMLAAWPTRCLSTEDSGRDGEPDGHRAGRSVASRGSIRRGPPCHMMFVKVILL